MYQYTTRHKKNNKKKYAKKTNNEKIRHTQNTEETKGRRRKEKKNEKDKQKTYAIAAKLGVRHRIAASLCAHHCQFHTGFHQPSFSTNWGFARRNRAGNSSKRKRRECGREYRPGQGMPDDAGHSHIVFVAGIWPPQIFCCKDRIRQARQATKLSRNQNSQCTAAVCGCFFCARTVFARRQGTHKKHGSICHITTAEKNAGCQTKGEGCKKTKKIRSHCRCNCINILHQKRDEKGKKNHPLAFFCVLAGTGNGLPEQASHKINGKRACTYRSRKGDGESNLPKGRGTRVYLPNLREKIQNWKNRQKRT